MKRFISAILAFVMVLGMMPVGEIVAFAVPGDPPKVDKVEISKTFETLEDLGEIRVLIEGENLKELQVQVMKGEKLSDIDKAPASNDFIAQYFLDAKDAGGKIYIQGKGYSLEDDTMPRMTSKNPSSGTIDINKDIEMRGSNINALKVKDESGYKIKAYFTKGTNPISLEPESDIVSDGSGVYIKKKWGTEIGGFDLVFKTDKIEHTIPVEIKHTYKSIVHIQGKLEVSEDIYMFPTQGARDSEVTLEADMLIKDLSIFLLKSKGDEYTKESMVSNDSIIFKKGKVGEKDTIKFKVPKDIELGSKHVILTNKVDPSKNINNQINKYKELKNSDGGTLFFTVIDGKNSVKLDSVQPFESSTKGLNAVLVGERILRISDNLYKGGKIKGEPDISSNDKMVVTYEGGTYDKEKINKLTREITVIIGNKATFREGSDSTGDTYDRVEIVVPEVEDVEETIKKDVYIQIRDIIDFENGRKIEIIEEDTLKEGFTFHPKKVIPEINKDGINPNTIMVKLVDNKYKVVEDTIISISGKRFLKYIYSEGGANKVKNPTISIADQDGSGAWFDDTNIRVLKNKTDVDEVKGAHEGDEIRVVIKKDSIIPESIVSDDGSKVSFLRVTNPLRTEAKDDESGPFTTGNIRFRIESPNRKPSIDEVITDEPGNVVIISKGGKVTIKGVNFARNIKLYIDGEFESTAKRISDTEIEFIAPKNKKPGKYQIRVDNISDNGKEIVGYTSTMEFRYIVTGSNPEIIEFNPKEGSNGTKVYMSGKGFKSPLEIAITDIDDEDDVLKFIGATVLFRKSGTNEEYKDMNDYYKPNGKRIELQEYKSTKEIIEYKNGGLELQDYHQSVIFEDEDGKHYKIYEDSKTGDIILETGLDKDNNKDRYTIKYDSNTKGMKVEGKGKAPSLKFIDKGISFGDLELTMKTPYKMENNEIIGNKVKVASSGKSLEFTVNLKSDDPDKIIQNGEYDVIVMNPDHEIVVAKDKFQYAAKPGSKPFISEILSVNEASIRGGNKRTIVGSDFREGVKVYIGEKEIPSKDVTYVNSKEIKIEVPKYDGDVEIGTKHGRKDTIISVLNPDRGTYSSKFIYVNPSSRPVIDSIAPDFGPIPGDTEITLYEGKEFKFDSYTRGNEDPEYDLAAFAEGKLTNEKKEKHIKDLGSSSSRKEVLGEKDGEKKWAKQLEILPEVYIDGEIATILRYDAKGKNSRGKRTITVLSPKGKQGKVKLWIENNDFEPSNKVDFEYKKIDIGSIEIKPGTGAKRGNTSAEIRSTDKNKKGVFSESKINIFKEDGSILEKNHQLVRFGNKIDLNMSNASIDGNMQEIVKDSSGRIVNNNADVKVGNLNVSYTKNDESDKETLTFILKDKKYNKEKEEFEDVEYKFTSDFPKNTDEVFLPVNLLKNANENYNGFEFIKISKGRFTIDGKPSNIDKLTVERGYSPEANAKQNGDYIDLKVPSYYSIGEVDVTVINADGSEASTKYIYTNPANTPVIDDVFREGNPTTDKEKESGKKVIKVDYKGGMKIHIMGRDFRKPSRIDIGGSVSIQGEKIGDDGKGIDHFPQVADREDYEELVFVMPEVPEDYVGKEYAFIVTTPYEEKGSSLNAATTSSTDGKFKIYVEFTKGETNPKITKLTPNKGPSSGNTKVTIEGEDFRKQDPTTGMYGELRVYVGGKEIKQDKVDFINSKKLIITTPPHESGEVKIKVENPDGRISQAEGDNDKYTYISNPKITKIVDSKNDEAKQESLSIEGGETIKILGNDFMKGAKVVFSPVLKKVSEYPDAKGDRIFIDGTEYILESKTEGTNVEFINSGSIKVKTPAGKLDTGGVIVINPDSAATPLYSLKYTIPEIKPPRVVRASLVKDEYIKINWDAVIDKATEDDGKTVQYEVYVIEGNKREFIGSTGTTGFVFRDIKPRTTYKFLVRAIGKYGSSKPISESTSNPVTTKSVAGPVDNDGKLGEKTKVEKTGNIANVVIGKDAFDQGSEYVIDTTRGSLAGSSEVVVSISAKTVINERNKKIKVIGKDYTLGFNLSVFENSKLQSNKYKDDAGVRFKISPASLSFDLKENSGETIIAAKYLLDGKIFVGSSQDNVESLNGKINFVLDYDSNIVESRRIKTINLVRYDNYDRKFEKIISNSQYGTSTGDISKLGTYTITGSRR